MRRAQSFALGNRILRGSVSVTLSVAACGRPAPDRSTGPAASNGAGAMQAEESGAQAAAGGATDSASPGSPAQDASDLLLRLGGEGGVDGSVVGSIDAWIAFDSNSFMTNRDIYVIRPDGSRLQRLTMDHSQNVQPTFSADGRKLAFASDRSGTMQIYVMDLGSGATSLVPSRPGAQSPAFSPDGQRIGYRAGVQVYTVAPDGSGERLVVSNSKCCSLSGFPFGGPVFTADGQWIVYDDYNAIYALHPDGTGEWTIVPPTTDDQSNPTLSPDGTQLALQTHCFAGGPTFESIVGVPLGPASGSPPQDGGSADGSASSDATAGSAMEGGSSDATGSSSSGSNGGSSGASFWTACQHGTRISPSSWTFDNKHPAWGPGNAIAWDIGPSPRQVVIRKGGVVYQITSGGADSANPAWSPVGTEIGNHAPDAGDAGDARFE